MKGGMLLLLMVGVACASVAGYHIEPVKAAWSGWTPQYGNVSQSVVVCWDSLDRIELFSGAKGNGGLYHAGVWVDGAEVMSSVGVQGQSESWVRFENWDHQVAFTKGKTVTIRFTWDRRETA